METIKYKMKIQKYSQKNSLYCIYRTSVQQCTGYYISTLFHKNQVLYLIYTEEGSQYLPKYKQIIDTSTVITKVRYFNLQFFSYTDLILSIIAGSRRQKLVAMSDKKFLKNKTEVPTLSFSPTFFHLYLKTWYKSSSLTILVI